MQPDLGLQNAYNVPPRPAARGGCGGGDGSKGSGGGRNNGIRSGISGGGVLRRVTLYLLRTGPSHACSRLLSAEEWARMAEST